MCGAGITTSARWTSYHQKHPLQPEIGTEQASTLCTRGIYANDTERGYISAYDDNAPAWANTAEKWWKFFAARPWLSGGFVWTGFDYRGEPTPYGWPCINSHFGIMDTCGFRQGQFLLLPILVERPHGAASCCRIGTGRARKARTSTCAALSNCEEVELFLNGQSLGRKPMPRNSHLQWSVKYEPGTLLASGYKAGQTIAEDKVETTGPPAAIKLKPDRTFLPAGNEEVSVVTVEVTDARDASCPWRTI